MNHSAIDGRDGAVLNEIFALPTATGLAWSRTVRLVGRIGRVKQKNEAHYVFDFGERQAVFVRPTTADMPPRDVDRLRRLMADVGLSGRRAI